MQEGLFMWKKVHLCGKLSRKLMCQIRRKIIDVRCVVYIYLIINDAAAHFFIFSRYLLTNQLIEMVAVVQVQPK